jgi:hypothetical protein
MTTKTIDLKWYMMWRYEAPYIVNEKGRVIDIQGRVDAGNRHLNVMNRAKP